MRDEMSHDKVDVDTLPGRHAYKVSLASCRSPLTGRHRVRARVDQHVHVLRTLQLHTDTPIQWLRNQSTRHMVNSSHRKMVWRVDRRVWRHCDEL